MEKEEFIELIEEYIDFTNTIDKIDDILHACIYETKEYGFVDRMFHKILEQSFNEQDIEDIDWWLYERRGNPELKYYIDKVEMPSETIEDLWNILCQKGKD